MGTDTIPDRANGQTIVQSWFNLLKTVIKGDFVPRNTSGVAESGAGSLGTSTYPFSDVYLEENGSLKFNNSSEVYQNAGKIKVKDTDVGTSVILTDIADIRTTTGTLEGSTDLGTFDEAIITNNTDIKTALQELESASSGVGSNNGTSSQTIEDTFEAINQMEINLSKKKTNSSVLILFKCKASSFSGGTIEDAEFKIERDSSNLVLQRPLSNQAIVSKNADGGVNIEYLDTGATSTGTKNYKIYAKHTTATESFAITARSIIVMEI